MSVPTRTVTHYDTVGNAEDVSDLIFDISPTGFSVR